MKKVFDLSDALISLCPNSSFTIKNGIVEWVNIPAHIPSKTEIQARIAELQAAEPMRLLRIERNQLLAQTDWRMNTDYPYTDQAEWAAYRTSLRNLPESAEPTLDESGNLVVDWPTAPDQT